MKKLVTSIQVRAILHIKRLAGWFGKGEEYQKFAIVCTARTGSTWLHTLLNSHPNLHSEGEIVLKNHLTSKLPFEKAAYQKYPSLIKAVGLKVFYDNPLYKDALQYLISDSSIKVLLLTREDKLAQFVSLKLAEQSSEWTKTKSDKTAAIELNLSEYRSYVDQQSKDLSNLKKQLAKHRVLEFTYEQLAANTQAVERDIQEFLEVKPIQLKSILKKQSTNNLHERISNWHHVKKELSTGNN